MLITVVDRQGSAPATPGQKLFVTSSDHQDGTVGGGQLELEALAKARELLGQEAAPVSWSVRLGPDLGMCCGGSAQMLFESFPAMRQAWLVGGGHVAQSLAPHLRVLGFAVHVTDARPEWVTSERFPGCRVEVSEADEVPFVPRHRDVALIMTHDHRLDETAIATALPLPFGFVGGVGSRAKAARIKARQAARGCDPLLLARLHMPVGLAIGARLPAEIAVSIAAALVTWMRQPVSNALSEVGR